MSVRLQLLLSIELGLGVSISPIGRLKYIRNFAHFLGLTKTLGG